MAADNLTLSNPLFVGSLGLVFLSWLLLALYALARAGQSSNKVRRLEAGQHFLQETLKIDRRRPIWLWRNGRIQADSEALAMLGISNSRATLEELIGTEAYGLPRMLAEDLHSALLAGKLMDMSAFLNFGGKRAQVQMDIKPLGGQDSEWPVGVIWLETVPDLKDPHVGSARTASYAIEKHVEELRTTFDTLPMPVWERSDELKLVRVNAAYVSAVDCESEEQVIRDQIELFDNILTRTPSESAQHVLLTGRAKRERHFGVIQGQRRALSVTILRLPDRTATLGVAVDVTGEEEALAELSRVLDAQAETLNRLHSPVAIFGPDKRLKFFNSAFVKLSCMEESWLASEPSHSELFDQMHAHRRIPEFADFQAWKNKTLSRYTEVLEPVEEMWHLPDGSAHRLVTQPHPLGGVLLLFEDVTDHLSLERSYNTLAAVQSETLDKLHEAISVFGSDGCLRLYNPLFAEFLGFENAYLDSMPHMADILEKAVHYVDSPDQKKIMSKHFLGLLATHKPDAGRIKRSDGKYIDYAVVPLPDGAMLVSQNDVTDSVRMEIALRERNEALEAADRVKSEFITNVSYELRTPLNSIIGFAEMLKREFVGKLNERQDDYVDTILIAAGELNEMVADVLNLAVIEAGEMELEFDEFDVAEMAQKVLRDVMSRSRRWRSNITIILEENLGNMEGDLRLIEQALYNLVVSTLRLAHGDSDLSFKVSAVENDFLEFSVSCVETSLEISEFEEVEAAFQLGKNLGPRSGLGLDLALVRSFVELHNGSVGFMINTDSGLCIECKLPRNHMAIAGSSQ